MSEKVVVCYGDSNTAGQEGMADGAAVFHPSEAHWPQLVQEALDGFTVVTSGLPGRMAGDIGPDESLHGLRHFEDALEKVKATDQLEYIVVALGVNDLQDHFERSAAMLIADLGAYAAKASSLYPGVQMIFVGIANYHDSQYMSQDSRRQEVNEYLASHFTYVDAEDIEHGPDGVHYNEHDHAKVAAKVLAIIHEADEEAIYAW